MARIFFLIMFFGIGPNAGALTFELSDWMKSVETSNLYKDDKAKLLSFGKFYRDGLGQTRITFLESDSRKITENVEHIARAVAAKISENPTKGVDKNRIQALNALVPELEKMAPYSEDRYYISHPMDVQFVLAWAYYHTGKREQGLKLLKNVFEVQEFIVSTWLPPKDEKARRIQQCDAILLLLKAAKSNDTKIEERVAELKKIPDQLSFKEKKFAVHKTEAECRKVDGVWQPYLGSRNPSENCIRYSGDSGKSCKTSVECEGFCLASPDWKTGQCSKFFPVTVGGCDGARFFESGKTFGGTVCDYVQRQYDQNL